MENNVKSVRQEIKDQIAKAGPTVAELVTQALASQEIERRKGIVIAAMATLDKLEREFRKHKEDNIQIVEVEGKPTQTATWSKAAYEAKAKDAEKIEKLSKAIDTALESNTAEAYSKLGDLSK